ncbi:hypothetical protein ABH942_001958 [Flavobacterium sp. 28YEA47A]|uniref:hypothetical protein n=1 Tax=Flavobacterium sp. 28YEA47A TaxID=3156276 RepID=UPI00351939EC
MLESDKAETLATPISLVGASIFGAGAVSCSGCFSITGAGSATTGGVAISIISGDFTGISSTLP